MDESKVGEPTDGVTHGLVIRPWLKIPVKSRRITSICKIAKGEHWLCPSWEIPLLIRAEFDDSCLEQMGLSYILPIHEPISNPELDSGRGPSRLCKQNVRYHFLSSSG